MKKHTFVSLALVVGLVSSTAALAKDRSKSSSHDAANASSSAPARGSMASSSGEMRIGVGFTTINNGASVWIDLNDKHSLQGSLGLTQTSPFNFSFGAIYRATLHGSQKNGFHVGGGFDLGTTSSAAAANIAAAAAGGGSKFFINIRPLAGFHFSWPGAEYILLSVDGGPNFAVNDGSFNFSFGPASTGSLIGMSVHYMF